MSLIKSLLFTLLLAAAAVQASTRDEIERLWNPQGMAAQPAQPAAGTSARTEKPAPRWFRLSNGRQVNLADWKVVLFMQGHCPYCHQFDPVLKTAGTAVRLFRFSLHPGWSGGYRLSGGIAGATGRDADLLPEYPGGHTDHLPGQRQHA